MIDDTNYADCLALYNFSHVDKIKGKESFSYIFNDNINYIVLFIIEVRSEMLPMIHPENYSLLVLSILAMIFLSASLRQRIYRSSQMSFQALYFLWL